MASVWLRRATNRTPVEQHVVTQLLELSRDAQVAFGLPERFVELVREHRPESLETWLEDAFGSDLAGVPQFRNRTPA